MSHDRLKEQIRKNIPISDLDLNTICAYFKPRWVERGDFLLTQGRVCRFEGFVVEGCFRIFTIDDEGKEHILYFAAQDWWLMDIDSFTNYTPSELNIQALERSQVLLISRLDKESLYEQLPLVEKLFRVMSQKALVAWQRRLIRNHRLTAKQRYHYFIDTYPSLAAKLKDRQIASYLGITHEFLSKIKREHRK